MKRLNLRWRGLLRKTEPTMTDRLARIRLLNDEIVQIRPAAVDRTKGLETKLSFIGVTAGVLAGLTGVELTQSGGTWGWVPLVCSLFTMISVVAGLSLKPYDVPDAKELTYRWIDADIAPADLEDRLLEVRVKEIKSRDQQNKSKMKLVRLSFVLLLVNFGAILAVAAITISTK